MSESLREKIQNSSEQRLCMCEDFEISEQYMDRGELTKMFVKKKRSEKRVRDKQENKNP